MELFQIPQKNAHSSYDGLFRYAKRLNFGNVHIKFDPVTGLIAIIAVHNLKRGPAIGGCRFISYANTHAALKDALRLSYMMSMKAAISQLPYGGAKAVLIKPQIIKNRNAYFEAFGRFVHELNGQYIAAVDSGTCPEDMDVIQQHTPYVSCTTSSGIEADPSAKTAFGVRRGMEAAVKFKRVRNDLENMHVTIQGAGHVGYYLAKELHACGARLTMCDTNQTALQRCVDEFNVRVCAPEKIYDIEADIFAPCALGAVLNSATIKRLRVSIVAGAANNQLAHRQHGVLLHERNILYAPDFLINAGGLIHIASTYQQIESRDQVDNIYHTATDIFERAQQANQPSSEIAEKIALERLG